MADYINPFSGLPDPARYDNNPFMREVATAERAQATRPFLDMARQAQELELQKQRQGTQEYMSAPAVASRMAGFEATEKKQRFDAAKAMQDLELLPHQKQVEIAELGEKLRTAQAKPYQQLFQELGGLADVLEKTPEQHRPMVYKQWADRMPQIIGKPLPEKFQQYDPRILDEAKNIKMALVSTPAHAQKLEELRQQGANSEGVARINAGSAANVARIQREGAMERTRFAATEGAPKTGAAAVAQLRRKLANPQLPPEERESAEIELDGYLRDNFYKMANQDPLLKNLASMAAIPGKTGQEAAAKYDAIITQKFRSYMQEQKRGPAGSGAPAQTPTPQPTSQRVVVTKSDGTQATLPADQVEAARAKGLIK